MAQNWWEAKQMAEVELTKVQDKERFQNRVYPSAVWSVKTYIIPVLPLYIAEGCTAVHHLALSHVLPCACEGFLHGFLPQLWMIVCFPVTDY